MDAFPIGTRVRTITSVWHGYTRPAGQVGTIIPAPTARQRFAPEGRRQAYWVRLDQPTNNLISVWESEIEKIIEEV